jgi:hypothetical protein
MRRPSGTVRDARLLFKSMSVDQLWSVYEVLVSELGRKIVAEKTTLEKRLLDLAPWMGKGN